MLTSRSTRSSYRGTRSRERTRALSVLLNRTTVWRHRRSSERSPSSNMGVACQQFAEKAGLVQALLVVAHPRPSAAC